MRSRLLPPLDGRASRIVANEARVESDCSATVFIIRAKRTSPSSFPPDDEGGDLLRMWNGRLLDLVEQKKRFHVRLK